MDRSFGWGAVFVGLEGLVKTDKEEEQGGGGGVDTKLSLKFMVEEEGFVGEVDQIDQDDPKGGEGGLVEP